MSAAEKGDVLVRRCEAIDRLTSIDLPGRGVIGLLYDAARRDAGRPLSLNAAEILAGALAPGKVVLVATGWLDRPHVSRSIAESDGPPGAAALARALHLGLGAIPFILVEEEIVAGTVAVVQAAGLRCVSPDETLRARGGSGALHPAAVIALPADRAASSALAEDLLARFDVGAFVAIEKGGENARGRILTSRGMDTTDALAKADAVREACTARGIATIGIGDGGNEIGMGRIAGALAGRLRNATGPSGTIADGVVPAGRTDALVAATTSNWGAYGVATALALLLERPEVMHGPDIEEDILRASAAAGFIDGVSGHVAPSVDGIPLAVDLAFLRLLRSVLGDGVDTRAWKRGAVSPRAPGAAEAVAPPWARWELDGSPRDRAAEIAGRIDALITIDLPDREVMDLAFPAFRAAYGAPLCHLAAERLATVQRGQIVVIATGFPNRVRVDPDIAESDGPVGAAVLARAVHLGLGAVPLILIEAPLVAPMARILHACGLRALSLEAAKRCSSLNATMHGACVIPLPVDLGEAEAQALALMAEHDIGAFISIEKTAANPAGELCYSRGGIGTPHVGKTDPLVALCRARAVTTIGIGDGGNELGMGNAGGILRSLLTFGDASYNGGIVPAQETDFVVPTTVSNWGGYGLAAALAARLGQPDILHDEATERRMLLAASLEGLIDGVTGATLPTSDGLSEEIHAAVVTMLRALIGLGIPDNDWPGSTPARG